MIIFTFWYLHVVLSFALHHFHTWGWAYTWRQLWMKRAARERYGLLLRRYARMCVTRWLPLRGVEPERSPSDGASQVRLS